jgi:hypothetical protein
MEVASGMRAGRRTSNVLENIEKNPAAVLPGIKNAWLRGGD